MGLLDDLLGGSESSEKSGSTTPLRVSLGFTPFRLAAMKVGSTTLIVRVTNITNQEQLVSFDVLVPKKELIGFEPTVINKHIEKRVGKIEPGETREVTVTIWSTNQTKAGNYPVEVNAYAHYLDYSKVIQSVKTNTNLRVVW